jgi:hypothetical protein
MNWLFLCGEVTKGVAPRRRSGGSQREPQQRTSDETRRIPFAFFGDSDNVFGKYHARAGVVAVHVNELRAPPRLIHRLAQHMKRLRVEPFGVFIKADHLAPLVDAISSAALGTLPANESV